MKKKTLSAKRENAFRWLFPANLCMSYSQLIRRSKLASYTPQIDQIYTTSKANASRSNFGLKSSLRLSSPSPFIRINQLDKAEYRKGTSEVKFVRKWEETPVAISPPDRTAVSSFNHQSAYSDTLYDPRLPPTPPSRQEGERTAAERHQDKIPQVLRSVNYFAMDDVEFNAFLLSLAGRTAEFKSFVEAKAAAKSDKKSLPPVSLFANAQGTPAELVSLVDQFLVATKANDPTAFRPSPGPHPTLALQYSSPTTLESSFAPPVPGRLLGPSPKGSYNSNSSNSNSRTATALATILGQVVDTAPNKSSGTTMTTWFPDDGTPPTRSNVPGRAEFKISHANISYQTYIERLDRASRRGNEASAAKSVEETGRNASLRSNLLRNEAQLSLTTRIVNETDRRPILGSAKYVGTSRSKARSTPLSENLALPPNKNPARRDYITERYSGQDRQERGRRTQALVNARGGKEFTGRGGQSSAALLNSLQGILSGTEKK